MRTRGLRTALLGLLFAAPAAFAQAPPGGGQAPAREPAGPVVVPDTPEATFKAFFVALVIGDEPALKVLTVPLPPEEFAWLLKGQHLPRERAEEFRKAVVDKMVVRRLKAGEEVKLPNGKVLKIRPEDVTEEHIVLMPEGSPLPTYLGRVEGAWRVDPLEIIAGRKVAEAAKTRAEAARKKSGN